jgi:UDP-glucose 4-epimerase
VTEQGLPVVLQPAANEPPTLLADTQRIQAQLEWRPQHSNLNEIVATAWRAFGAVRSPNHAEAGPV